MISIATLVFLFDIQMHVLGLFFRNGKTEQTCDGVSKYLIPCIR